MTHPIGWPDEDEEPMPSPDDPVEAWEAEFAECVRRDRARTRRARQAETLARCEFEEESDT